MRTNPITAYPAPATGNTVATRLTVHWQKRTNELGDPTLWFGSWLLAPAENESTADTEGDWFYSGHGGEITAHPIPADAAGVRIRCWPSEALEAEYVDLPFASDIGTLYELHTTHLTFDTTQPHSHLPLHGKHV